MGYYHFSDGYFYHYYLMHVLDSLNHILMYWIQIDFYVDLFVAVVVVVGRMALLIVNLLIVLIGE
jgi:hypothetical protein